MKKNNNNVVGDLIGYVIMIMFMIGLVRALFGCSSNDTNSDGMEDVARYEHDHFNGARH